MYMDEQLKRIKMIKWMNKIEDEHNLFITKSYVLIQILPIHNQKVCVN
jgi:hypothetical protein